MSRLSLLWSCEVFSSCRSRKRHHYYLQWWLSRGWPWAVCQEKESPEDRLAGRCHSRYVPIFPGHCGLCLKSQLQPSDYLSLSPQKVTSSWVMIRKWPGSLLWSHPCLLRSFCPHSCPEEQPAGFRHSHLWSYPWSCFRAEVLQKKEEEEHVDCGPYRGDKTHHKKEKTLLPAWGPWSLLPTPRLVLGTWDGILRAISKLKVGYGEYWFKPSHSAHGPLGDTDKGPPCYVEVSPFYDKLSDRGKQTYSWVLM